MEVRPVREAELDDLGRLVAARQADPASHIGYLSLEPGGIAAELAGLVPAGLGGVVVAAGGGRLAGMVGVEWDDDPPRAWWHGPFVFDPARWHDVAGALLDTAERLLPGTVTQQELAADDRHERLAALARSRGFSPEEASAVLSRPLEPLPDARAPDGVSIGPLTDDARAPVATLHGRLFTGAHRAGEDLDDDVRTVLSARREAEVLGYVAMERQAGGDGYIDFLGVSTPARGAGIGRALVAAACRVLRADGCKAVHLTVRESNQAARRLYERLGFTEERLLRPWRQGFTLG